MGCLRQSDLSHILPSHSLGRLIRTWKGKLEHPLHSNIHFGQASKLTASLYPRIVRCLPKVLARLVIYDKSKLKHRWNTLKLSPSIFAHTRILKANPSNQVYISEMNTVPPFLALHNAVSNFWLNVERVEPIKSFLRWRTSSGRSSASLYSNSFIEKKKKLHNSGFFRGLYNGYHLKYHYRTAIL